MNTLLNDYTQKILDLKSNIWLKMGGMLAMGILIGNVMFSVETQDTSPNHVAHNEESTWTCSMHPQIKLAEAGQCPICFMDLIPLSSTAGSSSPSHYSLSKAEVKLAKISTSKVHSGIAQSALSLSGKITYDESRVKTISAWFPGRLERLFVDYTGIQVKAGDHLFEIYSPELYSVQEELLQAFRRLNSQASPTPSEKAAFGAVKEKTKLLGLSDSQISAVLKSGLAQSVLQINSPISGIVTHKNAVEGQYVQTGEQIYSISDLSKVWLTLEAYEQDLPWLTYGQELTFSVLGLPGQTFSASISYVDPLVDPLTRSVAIRAVLDNTSGILKPGMLAEAKVSVHFNGAGQVLAPDFSDKWICPMHPEEISGGSGDCSVCGMDMVPVNSLNESRSIASSALLIPASSVLRTGSRALVYVEIENSDRVTYELREVILGPRVGEEYIVLSGLTEGEQVVSNGNFKIDSAMQIAGKQSMMSAPEPSQPKTLVADSFLDSLTPIYASYIALQTSLAGDDLVTANSNFARLAAQVNHVSKSGVSIPDAWDPLISALGWNADPEQKFSKIENARAEFESVSAFVLELEQNFGHTSERMLYEVFCPMAFDNKGASWLQNSRDVMNPYFGASMLSCGEVTQTFSPRIGEDD